MSNFFKSVKKYYKTKVDTNQPLYSIEGIVNAGDISKPIYVCVKVNNGLNKNFRIRLNELVTKQQKMLFDFSEEDVIALVSMQASGKQAVSTTTYIGGKLSTMLGILFGAALIGANLQSAKICDVGGFFLGGGVFSFATVMVLGNIITEIYGYKTSRMIVWGAFAANLFVLLV